MAAGRPSKYDPAYCDKVIDVMGQGYSLTAFAGTVMVARSTVHEWMAAYPEFSDAVKIGQALRTGFLEARLLRDEIPGPAMTGTIFALKNAAPDEWRDKHEVEHTGPAPVTRIEIVAPGQDDDSPS